ncbi:hypothetical protein [Thiomonas arsenitoxydans]|nr:hypothetical protein [Thiomonas arsenitoxydans]
MSELQNAKLTSRCGIGEFDYGGVSMGTYPEFPASVYFQPWVGGAFEEGLWGRRTLILGQSHYQWDSDVPVTADLTRQCIEEQRSGEDSVAHWTKIAMVAIGHAPTLDEKRRFWDSVAYANFIQESVGHGPRVGPKSEMIEAAKEPFLATLEVLRPDVVWVLGYTLWNWLPEEATAGPTIQKNVRALSCWYDLAPQPRMSQPVRRVLAVRMLHPSAGFSSAAWHAVAAEDAHQV